MSNALQAVITAHRYLNDTTVAVDLAPIPGERFPPFEAGAHIEVMASPGLTRPYSLLGDPQDDQVYRLGVLLESASRGGSRAICTQWRVGDIVEIQTPRNLFALDQSAEHHVLIGGGIGITPLLAMARQLARLGRPYDLHYCARDRRAAAFVDEIQSAGLSARMHYSIDRRLDFVRDISQATAGAVLYLCGPQAFMAALTAEASARGWRPDQIRSEQFDAEVDVSGAPFILELDDGACFEIAAGQTMANILLEHGYPLRISCEKGICGSCVSDLLEGVPDHRDQYLTEDERAANDCVALCCSRSKTPRLRVRL